jgi:hypothetical protein
MFPLISRITQQQQQQQQPTNQSIPHEKIPLHPPSGSLLYPVVNKKVEQQFSGRGCDVVKRETCIPTSVNVNTLGKYLCFLPVFCGWGLAKLSL